MALRHPPTEDGSSPTRRRLLSSLVGSAAAMIAGCTSSSSDDSSPNQNNGASNPPSGSNGDGVVFETKQRAIPPSQYDWNPFSVNSPGDRHGLFAQWAQYLVGEDRFYPHLIQDWAHEDSELVLTLSEDFTWAKTGAPVTADNLAFQVTVYDTAKHVSTRFIEEVSVRDRFELAISYPDGLNGELVEYSILPLLADTPPDNWAEADWEDDPSAVTVRDPDASGPLYLSEITDNGSKTRLRSNSKEVTPHPLANHYNWGGYDLLYTSSESGVFSTGGVDGIHGSKIAGTDRVDRPDSIRSFQFSAGFGLGLWFDHGKEPWSSQPVRRAFLQTIDPEAAVRDVPNVPKRLDLAQTGLTRPAREHWLGADRPDGLSNYDGGAQEGEALLAEAGYEPSDIDVEITYPQGWSDWAMVCQSIVEQLRAAGWNASGNPVNEVSTDVVANNDTDVVAYSHKPQGSLPENEAIAHHPYFALEYLLQGHYEDDGHFANYEPTTVSVEGEMIDVESELKALRTTTPREEQRPIVERLVKVVNSDLPCAILMGAVNESLINPSRFEMPESSPHFQSRWPQWWLPKVDESLEGYDELGLLKLQDE